MKQQRHPAIPVVAQREFQKAWQQSLARALPISAPSQNADGARSSEFTDFEIPEEGVLAASYFDHLLREVVPFAAQVSSPRCLSHMTGYVPEELTKVGELALALNQNMVKYEASQTFTVLERLTIAQLHRLVYSMPLSFYERHAYAESSTLGIVTSGGTASNISALWVSRNRRLPALHDFQGIEDAGISAALAAHGCRRAVIIGSNAIHYSIDKAAGVLGLGVTNCLKVATTRDGRIDLSALRRTIDRCRQQNDAIVAIVGVAGTTDCGAIDPLDGLADVSEEYKIPFHVDAAWGAPFLLSHQYRHLLRGIDRADSVTVDGHKQLHTPIGSSVVLFRDPAAAAAIEKRTAYMLRPDSGDLGARSLEGSRPSSVMLLHAALHMLGRVGYERLLNESMAMAQFMASEIRARDSFELLMERQTNVLVYRYVPPEWRSLTERDQLSAAQHEHLNALNLHIQKVQHDNGQASVGRTVIEYRGADATVSVVALRAVVANPLSTTSDIVAVLDEQAAIARTCSTPFSMLERA